MIVILPVLPVEEPYNEVIFNEVISRVKDKIQENWEEEVQILDVYSISPQNEKFHSIKIPGVYKEINEVIKSKDNPPGTIFVAVFGYKMDNGGGSNLSRGSLLDHNKICMVEGHVFKQYESLNVDTVANRVAHIANHEIYHAMGYEDECPVNTCRQRQLKGEDTAVETDQLIHCSYCKECQDRKNAFIKERELLQNKKIKNSITVYSSEAEPPIPVRGLGINGTVGF